LSQNSSSSLLINRPKISTKISLVFLLADRLLKWNDRQSDTHTKKPWRGEADPYCIWISEVMLQQTQVATVVDYYRRWLEHFPNVQSLAQANLDEVLKVWEGLGYYTRARNLHRAAQVIVSDYNGEFPQQYNTIKTLPGVGEYTASALSSIAFNQAVPVVDGNVLRVYSRLLCLVDDIRNPKTKLLARAGLQKLIPQDRPGDFNQALMDLGRNVCQPRQPQCHVCPVQELCCAYNRNRTGDFPVKSKAKATPTFQIVVGIIYKDGMVLIQRRPPKGLLGGLWEFPGGKIEAGETPENALIREIREETGLEVEIGSQLTQLKHAYTHFKINLTCFVCEYQSGTARPKASTALRWVKPGELTKFAFPKANQKILPLLTPDK